MKNLLRLVFLTVPLAAIGAGFLAWTIANRPPPAQNAVAERAIALRVIAAEERPVAPQISGFGRVSPARVFNAIAQVGGTVEYVNPDLQKGAILPEGAVLVRLSQGEYALAVAQARANIRAAEAKLAELDVSEKNQRASLAIEREVLELKRADFERTQALYERGTVSASALSAARSAYLAQEQKTQSIENTLALIPTQREVQKEQIAVYRASLETAQLNLARTELTLPFAARVASVSVETGQFVRATQVVAVLDGVDMAEVEAKVSVTALSDLLRVAHPDAVPLTTDATRMTEVLRGLNLTAELRLSLGSDTLVWPARVDRIADNVDVQTGTLGVIVQVADAYSDARPGERPPLTKGMFVEVVLGAAPVRGIVVPRSALRAGRVLVVDADSRLAERAVTPAFVQDAVAVLADGVAPGELVVVSDPDSVIPGQMVTPQEDAGLIDALLAGAAGAGGETGGPAR